MRNSAQWNNRTGGGEREKERQNMCGISSDRNIQKNREKRQERRDERKDDINKKRHATVSVLEKEEREKR